jgi:hypothetical protein
MALAGLNTRWEAFNDDVLIRCGVRSYSSTCQCAEDNFCGKLYSPTGYTALKIQLIATLMPRLMSR